MAEEVTCGTCTHWRRTPPEQGGAHDLGAPACGQCREGPPTMLVVGVNPRTRQADCQALVFDNRRVTHGRRGPVGGRVLLRVWVGGAKG